MKACIVGHGPSLCAQPFRGKDINSHDTVIRLKRSWNLLDRPDLFGVKTDVVCGSYVVGEGLINPWSKNYWLFLDTRTLQTPDVDLKSVIDRFKPNSCLIDRDLCRQWINYYRALRVPFDQDKLQEGKGPLSDGLGHLHFSAGMFAILYALKHLKPETLNLYGFDNVKSGHFAWSVTRGPDWKQYPDHNWKTESILLADVAKHYGYGVYDRQGVLCVSAM